VGEDDQRVTAETEPALKVEVRVKDMYGFLEFASHAAATMALAAVTKSTDGGLIQAQPDGAPAPSTKLVGTNLRWAKGGPPPSKKGTRDEVLEALGLKRQIFPSDNRTDCWFCLASTSCETHLITGVYDAWYATMPKGPVHPGHILLVPVKHTREGAWNLNDEWIGLVDKLQQHAASVYDMDLFIFERSMETRGGYHTHVQCVPVPRDSTARLQTTMMAHAKASGFDLRTVQSDLGITNMIGKKDSYFYAEIRTRSQNFRFFYRHNTEEEPAGTVPLQFAREVLASVLKNPKLAHWKACVVDQEQETELATIFRESFNATTS
jgi:diadenosine tetraphosphate (Ap4A) HIT family hydrolase